MIKLLVLDVDGTMTDGKISYDANGVESKSFSVKDGLAIRTWLDLGFKVAIITGRESPIVEKRAGELKIDYLIQKCKKKLEKVEEICKEENITLENVCAIGDDLNDLKMLKAVGRSYTLQDANPMVKPFVDEVLEKSGGDGAIALMISKLIKEKNLEEEYISLWL